MSFAWLEPSTPTMAGTTLYLCQLSQLCVVLMCCFAPIAMKNCATALQSLDGQGRVRKASPLSAHPPAAQPAIPHGCYLSQEGEL